MKISAVGFDNYFNNAKANSNTRISNKPRIIKNEYSNYSSESVKALFLPSFGSLRKIKDVALIDKNNGKLVGAKVYRDTRSITEYYSLKKNGEELGYMKLKNPKVSNFTNYAFSYPDDLPEVKEIRTIEGEEYEGIGTQLIKCAIERSCELGFDGELVLTAEKGYALNLSPYHSDDNPIPFYYKLGFQAIDEDEDIKCRDLLDKEDYTSLPFLEDMILTVEEGIPIFNEYYEKKFSR